MPRLSGLLMASLLAVGHGQAAPAKKAAPPATPSSSLAPTYPGAAPAAPAAAPATPEPAAPPAESAPAEAAATAEPAPLGTRLQEGEIKGAERMDAVSVPTPGELLAAIDKVGKADWSGAARPAIAAGSFSSRPQMALNLGGLIADGFIAVEAEDAQQVKTIGRDIIALATPFGIRQEILNRGKSLTDFAEHGHWDALKEELEATQNEVKDAMAENKDESLISLVSLGGWIRGVNAMSSYLAQHYTADGAKLLRQPAIAHLLVERLEAMPPKIQDDGSVKKVKAGMVAIEAGVSFAPGAVPDRDAVRTLATMTGDLLKELTRKK